MKHIAGFAARRVMKSDTWEAGYLYNTGKERKTNTGGTFITSERKFQRLKIFGTMDAALEYCREQDELTSCADAALRDPY